MWQAVVAVIGLLGSAAGAIWAAYVGTRRRVLAELEGRYDAALRDLRLGVYPQLWAVGTQLAIAWCPHIPHVSSVITGASRARQVPENLKALEVLAQLDADVLSRIDQAVA
jgi:aryl-alcohol dehydrogenase-like predicted oxidoreductase